MIFRSERRAAESLCPPLAHSAQWREGGEDGRVFIHAVTPATHTRQARVTVAENIHHSPANPCDPREMDSPGWDTSRWRDSTEYSSATGWCWAWYPRGEGGVWVGLRITPNYQLIVVIQLTAIGLYVCVWGGGGCHLWVIPDQPMNASFSPLSCLQLVVKPQLTLTSPRWGL